MKRKTIVTILVITLLMSMFAGCGNKNVLNPDADNPDITDEEWASEVFYDAVDKMFDAKEVYRSDLGKDSLFKFEAGKIKFKNAKVQEKYTSNYKGVDQKVIWAIKHTEGNNDEERIPVSTLNKNSEAGRGVPEFYSQSAEERASEEDFADTRGECGYLIVYGGFISRKEKNYYKGGISRNTVSTEVFVIDAVKKEVIHIEHIGTNAPQAVTTTPTGSILSNDALNYMANIT